MSTTMMTSEQQGAMWPVQPVRRDLRFRLPADRIGDWHGPAGPVFTAFLNTFSLFLPVGERFFIDSVRHYRDQVTDEGLRQAITAFIGQEAMHGREHDDMNALFYARLPSARRIEGRVKRVLDKLADVFGPKLALSGTIALEHFTALLADSILRDQRVLAGAEPRYAALWKWHALEETEHKAVAFDLWTAVMGRGLGAYGQRALGMTLATAIFWCVMLPAFLAVLRDEGKLADTRAWRQFWRYTFGDIGMLRTQLRDYIDYYRPDFHPWDHDNREYLAQIDAFLAEQQRLAS